MKCLRSRIIVITSIWSERNLSQDKMKNTALSERQLNRAEIIVFVKQSNVYNTYYLMFTIMINIGLGCGERMGLIYINDRIRPLNNKENSRLC